jgi:hypothetical protein
MIIRVDNYFTLRYRISIGNTLAISVHRFATVCPFDCSRQKTEPSMLAG